MRGMLGTRTLSWCAATFTLRICCRMRPSNASSTGGAAPAGAASGEAMAPLAVWNSKAAATQAAGAMSAALSQL